MSKIITKTLGELGTFINGRAFKPEEWKTTGVPIIRIENLNNPKANYNYFQGEIDKKFEVNNGDLLVSWSASLDAYVWNNGPAVLNQHIFKVVPNDELIDKNFFYLLLKNAIKGLSELVHGATMQHVNRPVFEKFEVSFPKAKDEQISLSNNIHNYLIELERAKESAYILEQDIKRLKYLILNDLFSDLKDTEKFKLGEKAITTSGSTPSRGQKSYWESAEIPWIKTGEIVFKPITVSEEYVSYLALKECSLKLLPVDSVLIAMYGQGKTRGQSAILKVPATINQACFAILPNDTWLPEFLQFWLMYSYQDLRNLSENRGGNQSNLNGDILNSFEVPAPSIDVQHLLVSKIKKALSEFDKMKESSENTLEEIKALPNRLLSQAFNEIEND